MTDPQPTDEEVAARNTAKGVVKEAMAEWLEELKAKQAEDNPPKRTTKPENSIFKSLFGG